MLRGINDLRRFTIAATDGNLGSVRDVYFDDRTWSVRYLVVDAVNRAPDRRVLVPPIAVLSSDATTLHVALSSQQVAASPDVNVPLQAATAVVGYAVRTEDGEIGHVEDVLVDDRAWAIRYLVVDAEKRWTDKRVLVSPGWLTPVMWGGAKTLSCIATAVDERSGPAGQRFHRRRAV